MQPNLQPQILWASLGVSQAIITGITFVVASQAFNPSIAPFMVLPALMVAGISLVLPTILKGPALNTNIVRWALAEAATLFGFVSFMMSGQHLYQFVCVGMGLAAWGAAYPRDSVRG